MRYLHLALLAALAALASTPSLAQDAGPDKAHTPQPFISFATVGSRHMISVYPLDAAATYPRAALLAMQSGETDLSCDWADGGKVTDCTVTADPVSGAGFGDAAVAILKENGLVSDPGRPPEEFKAGKDLRVRATWQALPSPCAVIDGTMHSDVLECASFVGIEGLRDMYPEKAIADGTGGRATVDCTVVDEAGHVGCTVAGEQPTGYGFGPIVVKIMQKYLRVRPKVAGTMMSGATFQASLAFTPGG